MVFQGVTDESFVQLWPVKVVCTWKFYSPPRTHVPSGALLCCPVITVVTSQTFRAFIKGCTNFCLFSSLYKLTINTVITYLKCRPCISPPPPVHKPIKKGLRTCISPGLIIGGLRYTALQGLYICCFY